MSSLSQGSSESHQSAFPYDLPDRLGGGGLEMILTIETIIWKPGFTAILSSLAAVAHSDQSYCIDRFSRLLE